MTAATVNDLIAAGHAVYARNVDVQRKHQPRHDEVVEVTVAFTGPMGDLRVEAIGYPSRFRAEIVSTTEDSQ